MPARQSLNMLGWVPLKTVYESDYGSLDSEEKGELDGDEVIEILDPTTGEVIEPDSVSLKCVVFHLLGNTHALQTSTIERRWFFGDLTLFGVLVVRMDSFVNLSFESLCLLLPRAATGCFVCARSLFRMCAGTFSIFVKPVLRRP